MSEEHAVYTTWNETDVTAFLDTITAPLQRRIAALEATLREAAQFAQGVFEVVCLKDGRDLPNEATLSYLSIANLLDVPPFDDSLPEWYEEPMIGKVPDGERGEGDNE